MKDPQTCNHYWKAVGSPGFVWFDGHAVARCLHCHTRTVVEYQHPDGIGPCPHAAGRFIVGNYFLGEPLLEKQEVPEDTWHPDPSYIDCVDCQAISSTTPHGKEVKLCPIHRKKRTKRAKAR